MSEKAKELRRQIEEQRAKTKALAEAQQEAAEEARLEDELAYEKAREQAYTEYGHDRVFGGEIAGAGFFVGHWPDKANWRYFVNQGILRKDKLTDELCHQLVRHCRYYPAETKFNTMLERNPNAAVTLSGKIIDLMKLAEDEEGKG